MHLKIFTCEHFDVINNTFNYKCETCQIFKHPFQKIIMSAKWNL